jgi:isoaspartyl peptidase/L-asparaginase-like protein (Ntn-hydrolase superfamily)
MLAFIAARSTGIGERFSNHHLERKIADLKHAHEEKIEALRADLAHLQDRGRRANELEFDAASKIWHAFVDAHMKVQQAILDYLSIPDLNKMSTTDVATFLVSD